MSEVVSTIRVVVPETLSKPHPIVIKTRRNLLKAKPEVTGLLGSVEEGFDLHVSRNALERALRLVDAIIKTVEQLSWVFKVVKRQTRVGYSTIVVVNGIEIQLRLSERYRSVPHIPLPEELVRRKRSPSLHYEPARDYHPTGDLYLSINVGYHWEEVCADKKRKRLEEKLGLFFEKLISEAGVRRQKTEERAREQREWLQRQAEAEERAKQERAERQLNERLEFLAGDWSRSQLVNQFVDAVLDQAARRPDRVRDPIELERWVLWAQTYSEQLNPIERVLSGTWADGLAQK